MYMLGIGLLVLSSWYLLKLFDNFSNDPKAKAEVIKAWKEARKASKGKNPFHFGRLRGALESYKKEINKGED